MNAHCQLRKTVELFGGVGTAHPTVAVIVGVLTIGLVAVPVTVVFVPADTDATLFPTVVVRAVI